MRVQLCVPVLLVAVLHWCRAAQSGEDLYGVLGVQRTASTSEIKRAYKKLARNWHPDKNKDPRAQEMFIKINHAYETLSNDENRKKYDNFGHTEKDHRGFNFRSGRPFFDQHNGFSFFYNGMPFQYHAQWKDSDFITSKGYYDNIVPASTKRVYLIEVVSEWCMSCMEIEDAWESATHDLKNLGIGVGRINSDREPKLVNWLNVRYAPSIVGVIGKRSYQLSTNNLTVEKIKKFVSGLFPINLVEELLTVDAVNGFVTSWHDNKPRVLLFSPKDSPPILYKTVALSHQDRMQFGFIPLTKCPELRRKFNVVGHEPTVFIFKEENSLTPDLIIEAAQLQVGKLAEIVSQHRFLNLPRFASQPVFDELCPQENFQSRRTLCVMLFTEKGKFLDKLQAYKQFASDTELPSIQFGFLHQDMQEEFVTSLKIPDYAMGSCDDNTSSLKIGVFWHKMDHRLRYNWLLGGWCRDASRTKLRIFLEDLQNGKKQLSLSSIMVQLYDEHKPGFVTRAYGLYKDAMYHAKHTVNWREILSGLSVVAVFGFILLLSVISPSEMFDRPEKKTPNPKASDPTEGVVLGIPQLKHATYTALITAAAPGQYTIVVLLDAVDSDDAAASPVMQAFADVVYAYSREQHLRFAWLSIPDHITWCTEVMRVEKFGEVAPGTVLALNGHRHYFSAFKPSTYTQSSPGAEAEFIGFNDSDSESEQSEKAATHAMRMHFPLWLDKLCCGLIKRDKLESWPVMEPE